MVTFEASAMSLVCWDLKVLLQCGWLQENDEQMWRATVKGTLSRSHLCLIYNY